MPTSPAASSVQRPEPEAGLCSRCLYIRVQPSARGGRFWRCAAADKDTRLQRYPAFPVERCFAYAPHASGEAETRAQRNQNAGAPTNM